MENNEKDILIEQIINIMYENSAFNDSPFGKEFITSTMKEHLNTKSTEELRNDYELLQNALNKSKQR